MLGEQRQWPMGALRGFLLAWYDYGYSGVTEDIVQLLKGWRLKGNAVGEAVANGSPDDGPYTDLELAAILDSATMAVADHKLRFTDFAYLLSLAMLARRAMQIAALKGKDLLRTSENGVVEHRINIPRVKQRGKGFRESFRSLAIIEDLYLVLKHQHRKSIDALAAAIDAPINDDIAKEVPIFLNPTALRGITSLDQVEALLFGNAPDRLHATTHMLASSLKRCEMTITARSERTGKLIQLAARRFRYTRGTNLRREGFGPFVIAELLDHTDIQNVGVYTENTPREAVIIDEHVGARLAPFAQACLGTLVNSERDAVRGDDPNSRVPNGNQETVGTCGNYGFCASGYRACYTCFHFQPWVNGPHDEVLAELYAEKERTKAAGCAEVVVNANDQLILAVEHCVLLCTRAQSAPPTPLGTIEAVNG